MFIPDIMLYHANCKDGFTSAWVLHNWMRSNFTDIDVANSVKYIPIAYSDTPDFTEFAGKRILVADFSFKKHIMDIICEYASQVVILDHHRSAAKELEDFPSFDGTYQDLHKVLLNQKHIQGRANVAIHFDMARCGSMLVHRMLTSTKQENYAPEYAVPSELLNYIQDRDLFNKQLPNSDYISNYIGTYPMTFNDWDMLDNRLEFNFKECVVEGKAIEKYKLQLIREIANDKRISKLDKHDVPFFASPRSLASDVAHLMLEEDKNLPFVVAYYDNSGGLREFSLRSSKTGLDVSLLAKEHGGGGHRSAAGFTYPITSYFDVMKKAEDDMRDSASKSEKYSKGEINLTNETDRHRLKYMVMKKISFTGIIAGILLLCLAFIHYSINKGSSHYEMLALPAAMLLFWCYSTIRYICQMRVMLKNQNISKGE